MTVGDVELSTAISSHMLRSQTADAISATMASAAAFGSAA